MSRRSGRAARRAPRGTIRARTRHARTRTIAMGAVVLVALVAVVALFGERWSGGRVRMPWSRSAADATRGAGAGARTTPALDLSTSRAYLEAAMAANTARDFQGLLAIVDQGLARFPNDPSLQLARAAALNNLSFRVEQTRGRLVPAYATSLERVRAAQEALGAYAEVQQRFPAIAEPVGELGLVLATWGFPEDARYALERAYDKGDRRVEILNALQVIDRTQRLE